MNKVWVPGYTRKDGVDVKGHYRAAGTARPRSAAKTEMAAFDKKISGLKKSIGRARKPAFNPNWAIKMRGRSK